MATVLELKEQLESLEKEGRSIVEQSENENRDLTDSEYKRIDELDSEVESLKTRIKSQEKADRFKKTEVRHKVVKKTPEQKVAEKYSISRAINAMASGKPLDGIEREMDDEAQLRNPNKSSRGFGVPDFIVNPELRADLTAGTAATAGNLIQTDLGTFYESLQPTPVVVRAGAEVLPGLVGDLDLPVETAGSTATWEGETDANAQTDITTAKRSLSPNRLGAYATLSKQFLAQNTYVADGYISRKIREATERKLDETFINGDSAGTDPFDGILNTSGIGDVAGGTNGAVPTWGNMVDLESDIFAANAEGTGMSYITTPQIRGVLKQTVKESGDAMYIMDSNSGLVNGYPVYASTLVPSDLDKGTSTGVCHAIVFGNYSAGMRIGNWGGFDIIVDPYSGAKNATIDVVVNSWWDMAIIFPAYFSAMQDALLS